MEKKIKKRKIKVIKTIRKTNFLKKSRERTLLKLKEKDEGVLSLIASARLYSNEYELFRKSEPFSNELKHTNYFDFFSHKMDSLNYFEFNVARKFIINSIKNNDNSHLLLSALIVSKNDKKRKLLNYLHMNLCDRNEKDISRIEMNLIDYVLNLKPIDLVSDNLHLFLSNEKNRINLNNQFVFFNQ